jgi:hypothetical protein
MQRPGTHLRDSDLALLLILLLVVAFFTASLLVGRSLSTARASSNPIATVTAQNTAPAPANR